MSTVPEDKRISLTECKKILNKNGVHYTDEEIVEIRKWMYQVAEIILDAQDEEEKQNTSNKAA